MANERDEALLSMDEGKIRQYAAKWHVYFPPEANSIAFWAYVHREVFNHCQCTPMQRELSELWLKEHSIGTDVFWGDAEKYTQVFKEGS